ncbi:MAG TPA: hypothetical protein VGY53_12125 [Isosphaeraceae bacterium]|nr:hypothetical protein [Isosphaeraceae bacterium]
MVPHAWPEAWGEAPDDRPINLLPLFEGDSAGRTPGWCSYTDRMSDSPEVEVFCGGINSKTPTAGAIWRQGNLLHFGFDLSPTEMNEAGRSILVDAIAYIARFTEDRPIMRTPSPFAGQEFLSRPRIERYMKNRDALYWELIQSHFVRSTLERAGAKSLDKFREWYPGVREYLHPDDDGRLTVDEVAKEAGVDVSRLEFFDKAIAALAEPADTAQRARDLLARYAPDGPGRDASAATWAAWKESNRDYLFFGEAGGYRWYIDPLAKIRGVSTAKLRGPARASR